MMSNQYIDKDYTKVTKACDDAVTLIEELGAKEPAIKEQEGNLVSDICSLRFKADAASSVLKQSNAIGVFGASQEGKSFLVSVLAASGADSSLVTNWNGKNISFIKHINPTGGDRESTGIVTRFTRHISENVPGFPINVKIMNEVDFIKVLVNSFFTDFDLNNDPEFLEAHDAVFENEDKTKALFKELESPKYQLQNGEHSYVSNHHMFELAEYVNSHATGVLNKPKFKSNCLFWTLARKNISKLNIDGRKKLFGTLWNNLPIYDKFYDALAPSLEKFKGSVKAYLPIEALVKEAPNEEEGIAQRDTGTIADVKALNHILEGDIDLLKVSLNTDGSDIVEIPFAMMACLTLEMEFPIPEGSNTAALDVLDFPGARDRGGYNISTWNSQSDDSLYTNASADGSTKKKDDLSFSLLLVRGKVGYLIEYFTARHEIDVMLCCRSAYKQDEVHGTKVYFTQWINENIGSTPDKRKAYKDKYGKIPFVGAFTMFDKVFKRPLIAESVAAPDINGTLAKALEHLKKEEWLNNWYPKTTFNQFFLVRKPNFKDDTFYDHDENNVETQISQRPEIQKCVQMYREGIIEDPYADCMYEFSSYKAKGTPEKTPIVEEVLKPNDGGISYLSKFLQDTFSTGFTQSKEHFYEQVRELSSTLDLKLANFAQRDGAAMASKNKKVALQNVKMLQECDLLAHTLCDLRRFIELDEKAVKKDYLENFANSRVVPNSHRFAKALTDMRAEKLNQIRSGVYFKFMFANLYDAWTEEVQRAVEQLPADEKESRYEFFLDDSLKVISKKEVLEQRFSDLLLYITTQLSIAYEALGVEKAIIDALEPQESPTSKKESICDGQCSRALKIMSDFNTYLCVSKEDYEGNPRLYSDKESGSNRVLFKEDVTIDPAHEVFVPNITKYMADFTGVHYYNDYFSVLVNLICMKNCTATNSYNISPKENQRLCSVLDTLEEIFPTE